MSYLPEEILLQVLYRLPVKSLGRCMCVSKAWNSLIKSPYFISTHLNYCRGNNNRNLRLVTLIYKRRKPDCSLHFDDEDLSEYTQLSYIPGRSHRVVGSSNGLLCVLNYRTIEFSLWNPIIRRCIMLPKSNCRDLSRLISIGFGFDSKRNDYKILMIFRKYDRDEYPRFIELYSLKRNSWKILPSVKYGIHLLYYKYMALVNGIAHVIAFEEVEYHNPQRIKFVVLGFDMSDDLFKEIMLPERLTYNWFSHRHNKHIIPYGELSTIAVIDWVLFTYSDINIWVMKKYGVIETWTNMFCIRGTSIYGDLKPLILGFKKNGGLITVDTDSDLHDLKSCRAVDCVCIKRVRYVHVYDYIESLVLLDQQSIDDNGSNHASS